VRLTRDVASAIDVGGPAEPRATVLLARAPIDEDDFRFPWASADRDEASGRERRGGVRTVVIDAGHGGTDRGSVGKNALAEKDVTLAVALALRSRIASRLGVEVVLTRETDETLATERRAQLANEAGGDLFISLHCNAWSDPEAGGFESYFLSAASTNEERATEAMENGSAGGFPDDVGGDVQFILWDLAQAEYLDESSQLAELIGSEMDRTLTLRNRGVKQGEFVVLYGAFMPAVLIEMGFISNEAEAQMLASSEFQSHVADAIASGIEAFVARRALSDAPRSPAAEGDRDGEAVSVGAAAEADGGSTDPAARRAKEAY
jgi:N-acetylmuramoyl-L-alanine amidase